jgi:hypothetical protein
MEGRDGMVEDEMGENTAPRMPAASARDKPPVSGTAADAPRAYGPRGIGGLIARVTRPGFRRRSPATSQIMTDWMAIMGPDLGARTVPQKLSAGTLTIACAGPAAMELQHFAPQLIARINAHVGGNVGGHGDKAPIQRLRFVQQITTAKAAAAVERPRANAKPPPPIDLEPGPVRDALARLAQAIQDRLA